MRILLTVPTSAYGAAYPTILSITDFPVGFGYLASALRVSGHEVFGLNPNNDPNYSSVYEMLHDKLSRSIKEYQPQLIGLGGLCTDYMFIRDAARLCRKLAPDVPIVCGGGIITNDAPFVFGALRPDFCITGEGEEVLVQLAGLLESGSTSFEMIPNLGYWKNGLVTFTEQNFNYPDIDARPFPDYEPFGIDNMLDNYSLAARNSYRYSRIDPRPMTIVTARSCPFGCTFCVHQRGPTYKARSVVNIIQELEQMYVRYRFNILIILDELFAVNRSRLREFCESVIERRSTLGWDFDWAFQTHASASLTLKDLKMAKSAGCYSFSYGLESASPRVLASMNKKTKPSQIVEAIELAHEIKIAFGGNFIFGDVAETEETILETLTFFQRYLLDDHVWLIPVQPYPGSKLFEHCIESGIIRDKQEFYERNTGGIYNMTSLPDALWFSFMSAISAMTGSLSWVRAAQAESYSKDMGMSASQPFACLGRSVYEVSVRCPHCGEKVDCLEPLDEAKDGGRIHRFISNALAVYKNGKHNPYTYLRNQVLPYLKRKVLLAGYKRRHDIFRLLEDLTVKEEPAHWIFATGCPHCNKRFRVTFGTVDQR